MKTKPLFNRSDFETVVRSAEAIRAEFFKTASRGMWSKISGAAVSLRSDLRSFFAARRRGIESTSVDNPLPTTLTVSGV